MLVLIRTCSFGNVIGCVLIMFTYLLFPGVRNQSVGLLLWIAVCQLGSSITILLYSSQTNPSSQLGSYVAFSINFFTLATTLWSVAIAKTVSFVIVQRNWLLERLSSTPSILQGAGVYRLLRFHISIWTLSLAFSLPPLLTGNYQQFDTNWYWFNEDNHRSVWISCICYYGPMLAGCIYNIVIFCWLRAIKQRFIADGVNIFDKTILAGQLYDLAMSVKYYPIICSLATLWSTAVEICRLVSPTGVKYWMTVLLILLQQMLGLWCCILYFCNWFRCRYIVLCWTPESQLSLIEKDYVVYGCVAFAKRLNGTREFVDARQNQYSTDSQSSTKNPVYGNTISDLNSLYSFDPDQLSRSKYAGSASHAVSASSRNIDDAPVEVLANLRVQSPESSCSTGECQDDSFKYAILGTPMVATPYTPAGKEDHQIKTPIAPSYAGVSYQTPQQCNK